MIPGGGKTAMRGGAPDAGHLHSLEGSGTFLLQGRYYPEPVQYADRFRAQVFRAGLFPRELSSIHRDDRVAGGSEQRGRGAAGRPGSCHQDIHLLRTVHHKAARRSTPRR